MRGESEVGIPARRKGANGQPAAAPDREPAEAFPPGQGLWIKPSRGVHTLAMRFPIDVVYLDKDNRVVHLERQLKPWRVAPVRLGAMSVLELPANTLAPSGTMLGDELEMVW